MQLQKQPFKFKIQQGLEGNLMILLQSQSLRQIINNNQPKTCHLNLQKLLLINQNDFQTKVSMNIFKELLEEDLKKN